MKPAAYQRHKYSGEFYKFVKKTIGDSSSVEYYFAGNIALTAGIETGIDKTGKMTIRSEQPLQIGCLVANIKDLSGNLILDDAIWQITNLEPVLNPFNTIESYKMRAIMFEGTI
jgi:hypothetical protein